MSITLSALEEYNLVCGNLGEKLGEQGEEGKEPTEREKFMEPPWKEFLETLPEGDTFKAFLTSDKEETPRRDWGEGVKELNKLYRCGFGSGLTREQVDRLLGVGARCKWCNQRHEPAAYGRPSVVCITNLKRQIEETERVCSYPAG